MLRWAGPFSDLDEAREFAEGADGSGFELSVKEI
jgi:hypothetical protein